VWLLARIVGNLAVLLPERAFGPQMWFIGG
jgi:hypothetical protein